MTPETFRIDDTFIGAYPPTKRPGAILLIVENDEGVAVMLATWVTSLGWKPRLALNMADGEKEAISPDVNLCILDLNLGDSIGVESIQRLRRVAPTLPIIVITGIEGLNALSRDAGAHAYFTKPIALRELRNKIEEILTLHDDVQNSFAGIDAGVKRVEEGLKVIAKDARLPSLIARLKRVWIIDDNTDVSFSIQALLKAEGYEPQAFSKPSELRQCLKTDTPDLLIADLGLPEGGGNKMLADILKDKKFPILVLTGLGEEVLRPDLKPRVDGILTKGATPEELLKRVRELVK